MILLNVTEWQCQRWPRMCPNCHCHNFALLSSFMTHYQMTYHRIVNVSSTTGATSGGRIGFRNCSNSVLFLFFIYFLFYIPVSPVTCMTNCSHAYSLHGYSWNTAHVISLSFNLLGGNLCFDRYHDIHYGFLMQNGVRVMTGVIIWVGEDYYPRTPCSVVAFLFNLMFALLLLCIRVVCYSNIHFDYSLFII